MKCMRSYLRLVSRLCIAFVLVFSIMFGRCVREVQGAEKTAQCIDITLSDSADCKIGEVLNTFVDDVGVTVYEVYLGEWRYSGTWLDFEPLVTTTSASDITSTSQNISVNRSGFLHISDLPVGVDITFTVYRNAWQVTPLVKGSTNVSSVSTSGFNSRTQYYGMSQTFMSGQVIDGIVTTDTYPTWTDKSLDGDYYVGMGAIQTVPVGVVDTSSDVLLNAQFSAYKPFVALSAFMTQEQYSAYKADMENNRLQEEQLDTSKNILDQVTDFFGGFWENITDALASVFIPDEGYFEEYFERLNEFFSDKLGMFYAPIDIFVDVLTAISEGGGSAGITFPQVKWQEYVLIKEQTIDLQSIVDELGDLQGYIYLGTDVIMIGGVVYLLQNKLREVLKT